MANLIANGNGNLTGAATWASVDSTALISSSTSSTTLTTSDQDSAVFQPGAITVDGVALKLSSIAATPAHDGTLSITLRNSTDSADVYVGSYNLNELCNNGINAQGGWVFFKFDTSYLLVAAKNYIIRLKVSATAGKPAVAFMTNGTGANWQHILRTTTSVSAAAGDDLFVLGELAAAATWTTRTVTMDSTTNTDYGAGANESEYTPSLAIGSHGYFTCGVSAATAYIFKLSGSTVIYPGGTLTLGGVGTEMPRNSSLDWQFDTASSKQYKIYNLGGAGSVTPRGTLVGQGLSRTTGKNVVVCKIAADAAVNATSVTVDTDTGWLQNDEIYFPSTTRTNSQREAKTIATENAAADHIHVSALTYAHSGTAPTAGEILLNTRNVVIRGLNASYPSRIDNLGDLNFDWVRVRDNCVYIAHKTWGSLNMDYCSVDGAVQSYAVQTVSADDTNWHLRNCTINPAATGFNIVATTGTNWTLQNVTVALTAGNYGYILYDVGTVNALTDLTVSGGAQQGFYVLDAVSGFGATPARWTAHSNADAGIQISLSLPQNNATWGPFTAWCNGTYGIDFQGSSGGTVLHRMTFDTFKCYGNATAGLRWYCQVFDCRAFNWDFAGLTSYAQAIGIARNQGSYPGFVDITMESCNFGVATGVYVTHSTGDIIESTYGSTFGELVRYRLRNCKLGSATEYDAWTNVADGSYIAREKKDGTAASHSRWEPRRGTVAYEITTFKTISPSSKLTPLSATLKLISGVMRIPVLSGVARTIKAQVRKDGSYNGNAPRLVMLRNDAVGVTADTVLDTFASAADTWELLSGSTGSPTDDGVVEVYVDCDGTAGNIYVDEWEAT